MWSVPPGSAGFCFCFGFSGSVDVVLSFMRGNVMAFLSPLRLPWSSYLSGELF